ncbi:YwqI/YxiC family protein [Rossellomorea vietnamensis]|uniref:YwqI/YxiC family protein n=1 Tax=Rossellomorea vietnamensis TaxID=218284 RepID=A0ACD4CCY9_9BACI|nr:YwqI/YxiC family protein [Rossellomorea vietnamensis]UXH46458.1 YwqI/YxiC family protein [Rossellomorea vietnamensis]
MNVNPGSGGGSAQQIKLNHHAVMAKLNEVMHNLERLQLNPPAQEQLGRNKLHYTDAWIQREQNIHQILKDYIAVVEKNIQDTKANVEALKQQDEAVTKS